jgi:hypothetical protein
MSYKSLLLPCFVCGGSVNLEDSKTDECGRAVHENCYVWTVILKKPPKSVVLQTGAKIIVHRFREASGRSL